MFMSASTHKHGMKRREKKKGQSLGEERAYIHRGGRAVRASDLGGGSIPAADPPG